MHFHQLLERNVLSLVELLEFVLVLLFLFLSLLVAIKVYWLNQWKPLLLLALRIIFSDEPLLVTLPLLFEHAAQQLIIVQVLGDSLLVFSDTFGDYAKRILVLMQQVHFTLEALHRVKFGNQISLSPLA